MSGLSREILKWLQSLDLSYSVKNVRRDFSNGFLVAEIVSRFFGADVQMHSYDNGTALSRKLDNWSQLEKLFKKRGIAISREMIDDVIHCKPTGAVPLVEALYTFLTNRNVKKSLSGSDNAAEVPPFAKPTASQFLKESIPDSEAAVTNDIHAVQSRSEKILEQHYQSIRSDKAADPLRYTAQSRSLGNAGGANSSRVAKAPLKPVAGGESPQIQFKEVQLKAVEGSIAALRASKENKALPSSSVPSAISAASPSSAAISSPSQAINSPGRNASSSSAAMQSSPAMPSASSAPSSSSSSHPHHSINVMSLLNSCVENVFRDADLLRSLDPQKEGLASFVELLPQLKPDLVARVLKSFSDKSSLLCDSFIAAPKEFWKFISTMTSALQLPDAATPSLQDIVNYLCQLGERLVAKDQNTAWNLFQDFAFAKLRTILKSSPSKRASILRIMYSFCKNESSIHINVIKELQDTLDDPLVFLHCLSMLIFLEAEFSDDLLDLYVYYCVMGMSVSSPQLRAAALSMLPVIVNQHSELVLQMLDRISTLADDSWWEVSAQLLLCSDALLDHLSPSDPQQCSRVYSLITTILSRRSSPYVSKVALSYLAKQLKNHPQLAPLYTRCLLSLPEHVRQNLLGPSEHVEPLQLMGSTAGKYRIISLPTEWNSLAIARSLASIVKEAGLGNLEKEHFDVLSAALSASGHSTGVQPEDADAWATIFFELKDYLYVALCDEDACDSSVDILAKVFSGLGEEALKTLPTLFHTLRMVFPRSPQHCQDTVLQLLQSLYMAGEPFSSAMRQLVQGLPDTLKQTRLAEFVSLVS